MALELHKNLGPGLLEAVYENALAYDLIQHGYTVKQQAPMPFIIKKSRWMWVTGLTFWWKIK